MQAIAHAVLLLSILPLCVAWCVRHRFRKVTGVELIQRAILGIVAALATIGVPLCMFMCSCGAGNNPLRQVFVPALGALLCVSLLRSARGRWLSAGVLLALSTGLAWHFSSLVLPRDSTLCRYTGDPRFVINSCRLPTEVGSSWYTPITGLHRLVPTRNQ